MPNTRGSRHGSGSNNAADDLLRVMRDAQIIAMRLQDISQRQIATNLGIARSTVQNALVEGLRQVQAAQIDAMYRDVAPRVMRPLRTEDGEIIYDGAGDQRKPAVTVDVPVAQLVVKIWERKARLYGLDLERSAGMAPPVTREALAALLHVADEPAIDVDAEELPNGSPAELETGLRAASD